VKILIADDHALIRQGLSLALRELGDDVTLLEAASGSEALAAAADPDIDLVLLDLDMPEADGMSVLETLLARYPTLPVVILSGSGTSADMRRSLDAGAMGYIPKSGRPAVMLAAVRLVLSGGVYLPPEMLNEATGAAGETTQRAPAPRDSPLTPRQREVLALLAEGHPNKRIATRLGVSEATIKIHLGAIFRSLEVANRTQAVRAAQRLGLLPGDGAEQDRVDAPKG
jgi:DNA-binding NarL/FixJ family response regulator